KNSELEKIRQVQTKQEAILRENAVTLERAFQPYKDGLKISRNGTSITLVLPDKLIFDQGGVTVSEGGRAVLTIVSEYLAAFPGIDASIISHTDNVLPPKEKTFKDTWDWSIARASGIVRVLTRELNVTANQLTAIGRGEFYPAASNETPEGRSANRRTEIVFYPVLPVIPAAGE
ncbi:MAG: flagellar motor protein MotB, partial [Bacteroidota bacterium]